MKKPDGWILLTPSGEYLPGSLSDNQRDCFDASKALDNLGTSERMLEVGWRIRKVYIVDADEFDNIFPEAKADE